MKTVLIRKCGRRPPRPSIALLEFELSGFRDSGLNGFGAVGVLGFGL